MKENTTQTETEFEPTADMIVFAGYWAKNLGNILATCEESGIPRSRYYKEWLEDDRFEIWLNQFVKQCVLKRSGLWYATLEKYARAGSYKHLEKLMLIAKEFEATPDVLIQNITIPQKTVIFRDIAQDGNNRSTDALESTGSDRGTEPL